MHLQNFLTETIFPSPHDSPLEGPLAIGGELTPQYLLDAYSHGIFPWPISAPKNRPDDSLLLAWFSPDPRGIFPTDHFHLSKSLKKFLKSASFSNSFNVTFNQNFSQVVQMCALVHSKNGKGTWITKEIIDGYLQLFNLGHAYSLEVWEEKKLVGGLYGVVIGHYFSGESMFHLRPNASKIALYYLIHFLFEMGVPWLDTQMVTPILESLGAVKIPRAIFLKELQSLLFMPTLSWPSHLGYFKL